MLVGIQLEQEDFWSLHRVSDGSRLCVISMVGKCFVYSRTNYDDKNAKYNLCQADNWVTGVADPQKRMFFPASVSTALELLHSGLQLFKGDLTPEEVPSDKLFVFPNTYFANLMGKGNILSLI